MSREDVLTRQIQGKSKVPLVLAANWTDFGGTWEGASVSRHGRDVFLQGIIKKSIAVVGGETVTTLPVGYRPTADLMFNVISNGALGRIDIIASSGAVQLAAGNAAYVSLSGASFVVD